jgi:hypothetical protein
MHCPNPHRAQSHARHPEELGLLGSSGATLSLMLETAMALIVGFALARGSQRDCDTNDRSHDCLLGQPGRGLSYVSATLQLKRE